jgi:hypothetical protein
MRRRLGDALHRKPRACDARASAPPRTATGLRSIVETLVLADARHGREQLALEQSLKGLQAGDQSSSRSISSGAQREPRPIR